MNGALGSNHTTPNGLDAQGVKERSAMQAGEQAMGDVIERSKRALVNTTDGPWVVNREGWACISAGSDSVFHGYFDGTCGDCGNEVRDNATVAISIEDAEFIAEARSLVPELVAEVELLRRQLNAECDAAINALATVRDYERGYQQDGI